MAPPTTSEWRQAAVCCSDLATFLNSVNAIDWYCVAAVGMIAVIVYKVEVPAKAP